ncbi:MAG: peptidylprolyl isomerase [Bacteroidales bacterium]|nr:peptidylprolyl isomerase [Bacteroidales bacterium]
MATLQKIRSKGPLLVIVIGLALFAFIAGDAWQVLGPKQSTVAGEVNGKTITAKDFQDLVEEYTDVVKLTTGASSLTEEQNDQLKDEVWQTYVNNQLVSKEAKKMGLTVTDAEIQSILAQGTDPLLQQTPFRNQQTGMFDKDMLNKFLVEYSKMDMTKVPQQYVEQYQSMYKFWKFIEKTLVSTRLAQKYQALIAKSLISNPVEAKNSFEGRVNESQALLAAVPYSSIPDKNVKITDSDLKSMYDKKKEQFRQYAETRDIKYIDVQVTASATDKAAIQKEMNQYTQQLGQSQQDMSAFIRSTGSTVSYKDLFLPKTAFPTDIAAHLDGAAIGAVVGPFFNAPDNTLNTMKVLAKTVAADSIQFRQIQFAKGNGNSTAQADSAFKAIKGGADFASVAKKYGQNGEPNWISSSNYAQAQVDGDNLKYLQAILSTGVNEVKDVVLAQANVILQVVAKKGDKPQYKVAVVKRTVDFSKQTYNNVYNKFSSFMASNPTLDKIKSNAEIAGYKLLDHNDLYSSEHNIGGVTGTREAMRWVFGAKVGAVSPIYECGESNHILVIALTGINKEGYRPWEKVKDQLKAEVLKDKKAQMIMDKMKNFTTFAQYRNMPSAVGDTLKHVTFEAPAYVSSLNSSEPVVGAYTSISAVNKLSKPIKGNAGVLVLQVIGKDRLNEKFNERSEEARLVGLHQQAASRLMNDLYLKGKVKDKRYLFF